MYVPTNPNPDGIHVGDCVVRAIAIALDKSWVWTYQLPTTYATVQDFCRENQNGTFILATGSHVVTVIDGDYYDAWDSGREVPTSVWRRGNDA